MASPIRTIAKYERIILMRSWFFRIFSALSLFVLFVFNMGQISEVGDMEWAYRAVPSNMPYANLFMLNLAQAIIAVFLSSEFIKRERKQDTTEVFYVRSMSNAAYLLGKTWSILSIFLLVNGAALLLGLIFNVLTLDTYVDWQAYLYYPLLISLPTLLFLIGFSCLLMCLIRNQALTFVLLLGFILSSLIYLRHSYNYLFDCMAFYLPLFHSNIVGFGDWTTILTLRGMYACFGLGFIFFSILLIGRLPQSRLMNALSLLLGLSFTSTAFYLGYQHFERYQKSIALPKAIIALNNQYATNARIDIQDHAIHLTQEADGFAITAQISGQALTTSNEFTFNLNPGLEVSSVTDGDQPLDFERKVNLLLVRTATPLAKGSPVKWTITYHGKIEENACFLDIDRETKYQRSDFTVFDIGRRYAFTEPNFLLLTPEAQWYLQAGVGYSDQSPTWYRKDFINYQLTVSTLPGLFPVSIGETKETAENTYAFDRDFAISQLSLSIGNYQKSSIEVDSLTFSVYCIEGHDYFKTAFPAIRDTLPVIIRERLGDFERKSDLKYPFKTFDIVEVPGQFMSYDRTWTSIHETNQPGLVYFPEKGMYSRRLDFNGSVKRSSRWRQNRDRTPEELQLRVFNSFLEEFFRFKNVNTNNDNQRTVVEESINPYYQFVQLYEMCNNLDSEEWPVLNRVFESYLRGEGSTQPDWVRQSSGSTQYELANMVLQEKPFSEILTLTENQALIDNVIELKGDMLFSMIQAKADTKNFRTFISRLLRENRFKNLDFNDFNAQLQTEFGVDVSQLMAKWFKETELPRYLISTPVAEKVLAEHHEMTRVRFIASNLGTAEGVIKYSLRPGDAPEKLLYLEPGQTKEVYYLSVTEPTGIQINTLASGNLPNQLEYNFDQINKTTVVNAQEKQVLIDQPILYENAREIIIDNESQAFEFSHYEEVSRLRKWLKAKEEEDFKYQGTQVWRAPFNWTATTNDRFFGEFVRSAFYIKAGDGSKEAKWKIPITKPGRYDVFYHVYKDESFNWDRNQKGSYQFAIPHENGIDRPKIELNRETPDGWISLGDYSFTSDTITITLSNESKLRAIFADAVKLVRVD
ncbi:MAG: hypothetical protein R2828_23405 [Saprospiraceae bacterium]